MLTSLGIRNYRNLKSLDIERLARVNLIAGKNNTGKTSLLEAVSLYAAGADITWINTLLKLRGDYQQVRGTLEKGLVDASVLFKSNFKSYISLFYQRKLGNTIKIGPLSGEFKKLNIDIASSEDSNPDKSSDPNMLFIITRGDDIHATSLYQDIVRGMLNSSHFLSSNNLAEPLSFSNYQFVTTKGNLREDNHQLWSNIALTDKENQVVEALKIIDPNVSRMSFIEAEISRERKAVVRMENSQDIVPLQSMGDGMNRILTIILALVNASNGYLLIDEFENGLYHRVQEDLWTIIFKLAQELNVQVFATTHSDDCIRAFEHVLSKGNQKEGQFIRLEKDGDTIYPVLFDAKQLQVATDHAIEIR